MGTALRCAAALVGALTHLAGGAGAQTTVALRGGTILPISGPAIANGTIVMRDGKIVAVGAGIAIPSGATIIDVTGKFVMPGLVDAATYYGIDAQDLNETAEPITPELRVINDYDPTGEGFAGGAGAGRARELLTGGVTTQHIGAGDATIVGGQGAVVKTAASSIAALIVREPASLGVNIGIGPTKTFRAKQRSPVTHSGLIALLRQAFVRAQEYDRSLKAFETRPDADRAKASPPARNLGNDALARVLHREMPVRVQANTVTDIRGAIALSEEFGFELIIDGGAQAYQVKELLASKKIPVILGPVTHPYISGEEIPDRREYPAPDERNAARLAAAGVPFAIASYSHGLGAIASGVTGKWLLIDAAIAAGYGLSDDAVLRAVTLAPAQILGVADRVGSLEPGKDADVIVIDGPVLSIKSWVERVYVGGELVYSRGPAVGGSKDAPAH
ncbi:MAG: amidohydrolase family protein [Gemmatimonadaceae bacterium]